MNRDEFQWCSWCFRKTHHVLIERNILTRNDYECTECHRSTVMCRIPDCHNMATRTDKWSSELCAQHDGTIPIFNKNIIQAERLEDFRKIFSASYPLPKYLDKDKFDIYKIKDGEGPAILFINGFLSANNPDEEKWLLGIENKYPKNPCYIIKWDSGSLEKIFSYVLKLANISYKSSGIKSSAITTMSGAIISMPTAWCKALVMARLAGTRLAYIIQRTKTNFGYILMGHSLGCRVIYHSLATLITDKRQNYIKQAYLFGGAVDRTNTSDWSDLSSQVNGNIYNFYSKNDDVLNIIYHFGSLYQTKDPIGLGKIDAGDRIKNFDVSDIINGHFKYLDNLNTLLTSKKTYKSSL